MYVCIYREVLYDLSTCLVDKYVEQADQQKMETKEHGLKNFIKKNKMNDCLCTSTAEDKQCRRLYYEQSRKEQTHKHTETPESGIL